MENYLKEFEHPSARFRGAPFWAWNNKLSEDQLMRQTDYLKQMGLGGYTIHCRTGLDTPYMGPEFLGLVKKIVEKAKKDGMHVYLYDEDRWPSGFGGGMVTREDAYRGRYLVFTPFCQETRTSTEKDRITGSSAAGKVQGNGRLLARYEISLKDGYLSEYRRLADGEEGTNIWYAYLELSPKSPWFNNESYVNTLDKKATKRFIEVTHEKYLQTVGEEFGGVIPSIFTDEPQFTHKQTLGKAEEKKDVLIPYTDDFEDTFCKTYGESFLDHLPEVFWELPDGQISLTRYHYHDHLAERFAEAYADTLGSWCESHRIALTGHMMAEPTLGSQTGALSEAMRHYRGFQVPGIDMLCDLREYTTAKQAQSAAHQMGRNEVTSELYGVTNWDFDFIGHKLQGDWQAALGVTHRVHHLSWVSMAGEAKRDYPASISYKSPWFGEYSQVEDHFARVNTALQSGEPCVKVGVIHPIESYWLYYGPEEQTKVMRDKLEQQFRQVTEWLLWGMMDFDYISESLLLSLEDTDAEPGKFSAGKMKYDTIVVPGLVTIRGTTVKRLEAFVREGGTVIFLGQKPVYVDAETRELPDVLAHLPVIPFDYAALMEAVKESRLVEMKDVHGVQSANYLYQMRKLGNDRILFIANGKREQNRDLPLCESYTVGVKGCFDVIKMDTQTGKQIPLPSVYVHGMTTIACRLYEEDSLLYYLKERKADESMEPTGERMQNEGQSENWEKVKRLTRVTGYHLEEPNVFMLDQAEYALDGEAYQPEEELLRIDNILRRRLGWPLKMEAFAQPWTEKKRQDADIHTLRLRFVFWSETDTKPIKLAMEDLEQARIIWNGEERKGQPDGWYVDEAVKTMELPGIRTGENRLEIISPYTRKSNVEWCYLLGAFGVEVYGNQAKVVPMPEKIGFSDLTAQKLPFYGGNLTYECEVDAKRGEYRIQIPKYRASLLKVAVDGEEKGRICYSPYEVDLGNLEGRHTIAVTAFGNRVNTFGTVHCCNEKLTWYGPNAWRTNDAEFSYEYQLRRTGILAAPILKKKTNENR